MRISGRGRVEPWQWGGRLAQRKWSMGCLSCGEQTPPGGVEKARRGPRQPALLPLGQPEAPTAAGPDLGRFLIVGVAAKSPPHQSPLGELLAPAGGSKPAPLTSQAWPPPVGISPKWFRGGRHAPGSQLLARCHSAACLLPEQHCRAVILMPPDVLPIRADGAQQKAEPDFGEEEKHAAGLCVGSILAARQPMLLPSLPPSWCWMENPREHLWREAGIVLCKAVYFVV